VWVQDHIHRGAQRESYEKLDGAHNGDESYTRGETRRVRPQIPQEPPDFVVRGHAHETVDGFGRQSFMQETALA
jgi:hypothetical protein